MIASEFSTSAWSAGEYDRLTDAVQQVNEDAPERKGWSLIGKFEAPLGAKTLLWFAEARADAYDNDSNAIYSYDRTQLSLGLKKAFN
jgi:hypothetical protein